MALERDVERLNTETTPLLSGRAAYSVGPTPPTSLDEPLSRKNKGVSRQTDFDATSTGQKTPTLEAHLPTTCRCGHQTLIETSGPHVGKTPNNSWWDLWLSWYESDLVSLNLENTGSVARDHLASERTFLAYVRTSLAIASSGVVLVQLFTVASQNPQYRDFFPLPSGGAKPFIRPLGSITIFLGILLLLIGVTRYFLVQSALTKGKFPAARLAVGFLTVSMTALVTVTFAILMAGKLNAESPIASP